MTEYGLLIDSTVAVLQIVSPDELHLGLRFCNYLRNLRRLYLPALGASPTLPTIPDREAQSPIKFKDSPAQLTESDDFVNYAALNGAMSWWERSVAAFPISDMSMYNNVLGPGSNGLGWDAQTGDLYDTFL